jgi:addiction module RelE/StbE family toxin
MNIEFLPQAKADMETAFEFYRQYSKGAASNFLAEISAATAQLEAFPESGMVVFDDLRRILLRRMPYQIFYRIEKETLLIISVSHQRSKPRSR